MARFADLPPAPASSLRLHAVPPPGDMDHRAYGAALKIPPIDLGNGGADGVHLWYLVDGPALLYRLLALDAETWGGPRMLVDAGRPQPAGQDECGYARLHALARTMERLLEVRRIGRGRPVDREALERSGVISDRFMDRVRGPAPGAARTSGATARCDRRTRDRGPPCPSRVTGRSTRPHGNRFQAAGLCRPNAHARFRMKARDAGRGMLGRVSGCCGYVRCDGDGHLPRGVPDRGVET